MTILTLERIAARLAAHTPAEVRIARGQSAAVAAVLRFPAQGPEVLLIQRADREGDRWSGHVSFPGGRQEPQDADLLATAIRETCEEVGLDLAAAPVLGRLDDVRAIAKGKVLPMAITPFVFHLAAEAPLALSEEAIDAFWLPLDAALSGALDATHEYKIGPVPWRLPCWRFEGRVVWGLTYQMLRSLLQLTV